MAAENERPTGASEHIAGNIGVDALIPDLCVYVWPLYSRLFFRSRVQTQLEWQTTACIHVDFAVCAMWCCRARIVDVHCGGESFHKSVLSEFATQIRIVFEYPCIPFVVMLLVRVLTYSRRSG